MNPMLRTVSWRRLAVRLAAFVLASSAALALPPGFVEAPVAGGWNAVVGVTFDANGTMYAWEKGGKVWIVHPDGTKHVPPLIDISEEVGDWSDFGLLGFALDPAFLVNGRIYLLYVVDRHHLLYYGTPSYNPAANEYFTQTIGRITRYTANPADGFESVDPASRRVLVGETISTGFPLLHDSHGVGSLVFGIDGTLLASCGDGASYEAVDNGGTAGNAQGPQALADGIITVKENVGAFRAQLVDSHSGKILRIDPETGDGLPSNPFFDPSAPRSPRSRVWALGLRNPYRLTIRPGTGVHDPALGDPGTIYVGDVGWETWEEVDVISGAGRNMGWPIFEGLTINTGYFNARKANLDAPNPLFGVGGCTKQYFDFQDLLVQDDLAPSWPNPCNASQQVPSSLRHLHRRPVIDYRNSSGPARAGIYDGAGHAATINIDDAASPVTGDSFGGNTSTGGVFYTGTAYPPEYWGAYFHGDYGSSWIRYLTIGAAGTPVSVHRFIDSGRHPVAFATDPITKDVFYVEYGSAVIRLRYLGDGDLPPKASAVAERDHGPGPLEVRFFGEGSSDPEGWPLDYAWDFGDGATSTLENPIHVFAPPGSGPTVYTVSLTVTDALGQSASATTIVAVNDEPPTIVLTSPVDGSTYPTGGATALVVAADVSDPDDAPGALACTTQVYFHHSNHVHPAPLVYACGTAMMTTPVGCDGVLYYFRATASVTDPSGLTARDEANVYPACPSSSLTADAGTDVVVVDADRDGGETVVLDGTGSADALHTITRYEWRRDEAEFATGSLVPWRFPIGTHVVTLVVANDHADFAIDTVRIVVEPGNGSAAVPEARYRLLPESGAPPLDVAFDGTGSSDPDGQVVAWAWDFGDGGTAAGPLATHRYATPGSYEATLTVTDDDGLQDTDVHTVRVLDPRLVLLFRMDEGSGTTTVDGSGLRNDGNLTGGTAWITGVSGPAGSFDGSNDRIEAPPVASLDLRNALTIAAWVRRDVNGSADAIAVKGQTRVPYGLRLDADGRLRFTANAGAPAGSSGAGAWTSSGAVGAGAWRHVAVTYDGAHVRFYVDGALDPSQPAASVTLGRVLEPLFVGGSPFDGAYLDGSIDDLRVYNWALPAADVDALARGNDGIDYQYYEGIWNVLPNFDALPVIESGAVPNVTLEVRNRDNEFALRFKGCLAVPAAGTYTFYTTSDDGSKLSIGSTQVVDNDGLHPAQERSGTISLAAGLHPITVTFLEKGGGQLLEARWEGPGIAKQLIPDSVLYRDGCAQGFNRRPVANADAVQLAVGAQAVVPVRANDSDPDPGDTITVVRADPPLHGTVGTNGTTVTYVHDGSPALLDAFEYMIDDGHGTTARATVQVRACAAVDATCDGFDDDCNGTADEEATVPGEATHLVFPWDPLRATLAWTPPATGPVALTYDVVRTSNPADFVTNRVCVESDGSDTTAVDAAIPPPGGLFTYVVRVQGCGGQTAGRGSNGQPRVVGPCP